MHWCVAGLIVSLLALIAGIAYQSPLMLIDAVVMGVGFGLLAWFGRKRGWFRPW
jgi:uncharacterized membrane protein YccC